MWSDNDNVKVSRFRQGFGASKRGWKGHDAGESEAPGADPIGLLGDFSKVEANASSPLHGGAADPVGGRLPKSIESWRLIVAGAVSQPGRF